MPVPQQFASAGPIDFVALSLDASGERLAAAFRVGCGEQAHLQFSTFELERPLARARSAELRTELSLDSFAGAPIVDGPVVVHVSRGFRVTERGDASSGGWLVSWIVREGDATKLLAARISEDGALLDSPALEVAPALFDRMVAFSAAGDRVSYLGVNYTTDRLERTTILCNAR
jgi:hypothetical protein